MSKKRKGKLGVKNTYRQNSQKNSVIHQHNSMSNRCVKNTKVSSKNEIEIGTIKNSGESAVVNEKKASKLKFLKESKFNWICLILIMVSTLLMILSQISSAPNGALLTLAVLFVISVLISVLMPLAKLMIVKNGYADKKTSNGIT